MTHKSLHRIDRMNSMREENRQQTAYSLTSSSGSVHDSVVSYRHVESKQIPRTYSILKDPPPVLSHYSNHKIEEWHRTQPVPLKVPEATEGVETADPEDQLEAISSLLHELQGLRRLRVVLKRELIGIGRDEVANKINTTNYTTPRAATIALTSVTPKCKVETLRKNSTFRSTRVLENDVVSCRSREARGVANKDCVLRVNGRGSFESNEWRANGRSYLALLQRRQKHMKQTNKQKRQFHVRTRHSCVFKIKPSQIPKPVGSTGNVSRRTRSRASRIPKPLSSKKLPYESNEVESLDKAIDSISTELDQLNLRQKAREAQKHHLLQNKVVPVQSCVIYGRLRGSGSTASLAGLGRMSRRLQRSSRSRDTPTLPAVLV